MRDACPNCGKKEGVYISHQDDEDVLPSETDVQYGCSLCQHKWWVYSES